MKSNEFVTKLALMMPTFEQLAAAGIEGAEAIDIRQQMTPIRRPQVGATPDVRDEAITLVDSWDVSRIEIGMLRFESRAIQNSRGWQVGTFEADPLIVCDGSGEVVVYDLSAPDHVLWPVAENGCRLFDALIVAIDELSRRLFSAGPIDRGNELRRTVENCVALAGGGRYRDFWLMLLGVE